MHHRAPCDTPVGATLAVALTCRTGANDVPGGASPAPTRLVRVPFDPFGAGGVWVSDLSGGSLRSPGAKHGSTPSGPQVLRGSRVSSQVVGAWEATGGVLRPCQFVPCSWSTNLSFLVNSSLIPRQLTPRPLSTKFSFLVPRGQEGPEGGQPCLAPGERSEPGVSMRLP